LAPRHPPNALFSLSIHTTARAQGQNTPHAALTFGRQRPHHPQGAVKSCPGRCASLAHTTTDHLHHVKEHARPSRSPVPSRGSRTTPHGRVSEVSPHPFRDAAHQAIDRHRRAITGTSGFPRAPKAQEEMETVGFEPTTPCLQSRCSPTELRPRGRGLPTAPPDTANGNAHAPPHRMSEEPNFAQQNLVGQGGLEPPTPRLSSVCSNQLSYWPRICGVAQSGEGCAVGARRGLHHDQARRQGRYVYRQPGIR
jgi:hypothetical protein